MSELFDVLRAIIREEIARCRSLELATVSQVFPKEADDNPSNHQLNLKLRGSGVELQRVPMLVGRAGLSTLPRVGDLMAVGFVGGELNAPVALGVVYDDKLHPPQAALAELVYQPPDDEDGSVRRLHIELPSGSKITLNDDTLTVESGETQVSVARDGDVSIKAKGKVELSAEGDLTLNAGGDLKLAAQGNVSISGTSTKLEGSADTKVSGPQITLGGLTQFSPS